MTPDSSLVAIAQAQRLESVKPRPRPALTAEPTPAKERKPFRVPPDPHFKLVARHEAAHVAAAHLLGWRIEDVALFVAFPASESTGACHIWPPEGCSRQRRLEERAIILLAPRAAGGEAGTPDDLARAWREVGELAELQRYPTDWLFRRLLRRARGLVASRKFDLLLERVTYELLAFGRLEEAELRDVLRDAKREVA